MCVCMCDVCEPRACVPVEIEIELATFFPKTNVLLTASYSEENGQDWYAQIRCISKKG